MSRPRLRVAREDDVTAAIRRQSAMYLQRAHDAEAERDAAQREADIQLGDKLAAQMTLKAVCDALDLPMVSLGNGWTEATPKILTRIEAIVDEGARGFRERDRLAARVAELEAALREIDKLDGRYADLNTARHAARAALARPREQQEPQT